MSRILFFVLLALAVYLVWRLLQKRQLPPAPPIRQLLVCRW